MNEVLKTKWLWRFAKEENTLWKKVILSKCETYSLSYWWRKRNPYAHGVSCQKSIHAGLDFFKSLIYFEVRNGSKVFLMA